MCSFGRFLSNNPTFSALVVCDKDNLGVMLRYFYLNNGFKAVGTVPKIPPIEGFNIAVRIVLLDLFQSLN